MRLGTLQGSEAEEWERGRRGEEWGRGGEERNGEGRSEGGVGRSGGRGQVEGRGGDHTMLTSFLKILLQVRMRASVKCRPGAEYKALAEKLAL